MQAESISLDALLSRHTDVARVEAFIADVNGVPRGKWLTRDKAVSLQEKGLALPRSAYALDIWGCDVPGAGLAFGTGDPDGLCYPVPGRAAVIPAIDPGSLQVLLAMRGADGAPFAADPRGVLTAIVARLAAQGFRPVVATELEFYLYRPDRSGRPVPPDATDADDLRHVNETLSLATMAARGPLFDDIYAACAAFGIPADTLLSEAGPGQFELNLIHRDDAVAAADDAILFKRVIKAVAHKHGLGATFMAKPYGDASGSGMHIHVSLLDGDGRNVLAGADGAPSDALFHAVGGLLRTMPDMMLAFAPHANSYRRFRKNAHAPVTAGWGIDDRSAAVRVVVADARSTRIEHRVSGADCNPYLAVAAVLAGVILGIENQIVPPPEQDRTAPDAGAPLPTEWGAAIDAFASSDQVAQAFGTPFQAIFTACKRQDREVLLSRVSDIEYSSYLRTL